MPNKDFWTGAWAFSLFATAATAVGIESVAPYIGPLAIMFVAGLGLAVALLREGDDLDRQLKRRRRE